MILKLHPKQKPLDRKPYFIQLYYYLRFTLTHKLTYRFLSDLCPFSVSAVEGQTALTVPVFRST